METLRTLDGEDHTLTPEMLVVADERHVRSLAGIMGGLDSEISGSTSRVVVEGANWDRASVRLTAGALNLSTEASRRFGRGVDPGLTAPAVSWAIALIVELGGGEAADGLVDVYPNPQPPAVITIRSGQVDALLGATYPQDTTVSILRSLGFQVQEKADELQVTVPGHRRFDVSGRADLAEEVARIAGYESIPGRGLIGALPKQRADGDAGYGEELRARNELAAAGMQEVITYSLLDPEQATTHQWVGSGRDELISVSNPQSSERSVLRQSLVPGLLDAAAKNARHRKRVQLFELARTWRGPLHPAPTEERHLGFVMFGPKVDPHWSEPGSRVDFFDAKGVLEHLCAGFAQQPTFAVPKVARPFLHPGRSAEVLLDDRVVGFVGELHPRHAEAAGLDQLGVLVGEINFDAIAVETSRVRRIPPPSRYPSATRDIAVVVDERLEQQVVAQGIRDVAGTILVEARLFDVYRGDPVPAGKKSLAYSLTYQAPDRTLDDQEVNDIQARVTAFLRTHFAGEIRGDDVVSV